MAGAHMCVQCCTAIKHNARITRDSQQFIPICENGHGITVLCTFREPISHKHTHMTHLLGVYNVSYYHFHYFNRDHYYYHFIYIPTLRGLFSRTFSFTCFICALAACIFFLSFHFIFHSAFHLFFFLFAVVDVVGGVFLSPVVRCVVVVL